jgi:hypothetical protein
MAEDVNQELLAEIKAFRAELRVRAEEHERAMKRSSVLDLPSIDGAELDLAQIRALMSQRYDQARLENRLRAVERRLADLEAQDG